MWWSESSSGCPNTAMHPVRQLVLPSGLRNALFAPIGTNTWLLAELAATECDVLAGCWLAAGPVVTAATLKVEIRDSRFWSAASITAMGVAPDDVAGNGLNGLPLPVA